MSENEDSSIYKIYQIKILGEGVNSVIRIGCEIFVLNNDNILLGKRKNCYGAGEWGLPGGHLEYNEKLVDAATRELKEELGIEATDLRICCIVDDVEGNKHYIHVAFVLTRYNGNIELLEPDKCEEWRFFDQKKLPPNVFSAHKKIIEAFLLQKMYYN
jgi:8-oxo-dGTP diphosphatase